MKVTLKQIADSLGLSVATVSKVLNNKDYDISEPTKKMVLDKAKELNYTVNEIAKSMKTNRTKTLGIIIPDIKNSFFTDMATAIEEEAIKNGYSIFLSNSYEKLEREIYQIKTLISKRADGIIIAATNERDSIREKKILIDRPIVSIDRNLNYNNVIASIDSDNFGGAYCATYYLIKLGHSNIMYISGPVNTNTTKERKNGYIKALKDSNIKINKQFIRYGNYTVEFGYNTIMKNPLPNNISAILCGNDLIAVGVMKALKQKGISVPNEINIIGIDNTDISAVVSPSLTTISQPSDEIGKLAVKTLINYFNGEKYDKYVRLNQKLIVRESTCIYKL